MKNIGVIFDWDGVIVDSSHLHVLSWQRVAEEEGKRLDQPENLGCLGLKTEMVITDLLGWTKDQAQVVRLTMRKEEVFRQMVREEGVSPQSGVIDLLQALKQRDIPCAVGSSAPRLNIEEGMNVLNIRLLFGAIVSGSDVVRGKPAPDIFLTAAQRLRCEPSNCIVFEDAPAGVEAARAAGIYNVGVLSTHPADTLRNADRIISSFNDISAEDVAGWLDEAPA